MLANGWQIYFNPPGCALPPHPAGDAVCNEVLMARNGPTDWARLMEPLPFFDGFKHFLQVGAVGEWGVGASDGEAVALRSCARLVTKPVLRTACFAAA